MTTLTGMYSRTHKDKINKAIKSLSSLFNVNEEHIKFYSEDEDCTNYVKFESGSRTLILAYINPFPGCCGAAIIDNITIYASPEKHRDILKIIIPLFLDFAAVDVAIYITADYQLSLEKTFKELGYKSVDLGKNKNTSSKLTAWVLK